MELEDENSQDTVDEVTGSGGFLKFYGLYWDRKFIVESQGVLPGIPEGWTGRGIRGVDRDTLWMNFWGQQGVYVLYDENIQPVYTGQAGLRRSRSTTQGRSIGDRLSEHLNGKYRNGWKYFSWFGFLDSSREAVLRRRLKDANLDDKLDPKWEFRPSSQKHELNMLLNSFEAILIEAFVPRFNSRGGNLLGASYVDQFESTPAYIRDMLPKKRGGK